MIETEGFPKDIATEPASAVNGLNIGSWQYPRDITTVQEGLEKLSQAECLVALDEVMARRPHNKTDLRWQISLWRRDRPAWRDARDRRADAKEAAADE